MLSAHGCGKETGSAPADKARRIAEVAGGRSPSTDKALARALSDRDPDVRKAALLGLSDHVTPDHRPAIERATSDRDAGVRAGAAITLSLYKDRVAAEKLGELVSSDPDEAVRLAAASGLGLNESQKAIVLLLDASEKNANPKVQVQAMKALLPKLGLRPYRRLEPQAGREWRALVEELKHNRIVQAAHGACGAKLVFRPEDKTPDAPGHQE